MFSLEHRFIPKVREQFRHQPRNTIRPNANTTKDPKGMLVIGESSKQGAKGMLCYKCHGYAHVAAECLSRIRLVEGIDLDDNKFEEEIYVR